MTLAKATAHRSQPTHKLLPTVGLKGLRAKEERIVNLLYDNDFSGDYEIVTNTEIDPEGVFVGFGIVPVLPDRWSLSPSEEKLKPVNADSRQNQTPVLPTGVVVEFINERIEISYDPSIRADWVYEFQYQLKTGSLPQSNAWNDLVLQENDNYAYSPSLIENSDYFVRWRTSSTGGTVSDWVFPIPVVNSSTLTLTGTPSTTATVNTPYAQFTVGVTGGEGPYIHTDTLDRLPPGVSVDAETGLVSGTPTATGVYADVILRVQDNNGKIKNFPTFTITVS